MEKIVFNYACFECSALELGKHFIKIDVFRFLKQNVKGVTDAVAGDYMDMKMIDRLAGSFSAVVQNIETDTSGLFF